MTASFEADIEAPPMASRLILIKGALRRRAAMHARRFQHSQMV
jgi:hypothetical protein